jgi:hypothetical protein
MSKEIFAGIGNQHVVHMVKGRRGGDTSGTYASQYALLAIVITAPSWINTCEIILLRRSLKNLFGVQARHGIIRRAIDSTSAGWTVIHSSRKCTYVNVDLVDNFVVLLTDSFHLYAFSDCTLSPSGSRTGRPRNAPC